MARGELRAILGDTEQGRGGGDESIFRRGRSVGFDVL